MLVAPVLAAAGYYVQSYDLAGQYESAAAGPAAGKRYDYELFRDDMVALLEDGRRPRTCSATRSRAPSRSW